MTDDQASSLKAVAQQYELILIVSIASRRTLSIAFFGTDTQDVAEPGKSKLLRDTSLSQHRIGGVPGQDFRVHGETSLRDRTVPDFVVTFTWPLELTSVRTKDLLHARSVTGHQKVRMPLSSCWYNT
jgi:hypothetical protein